MIKWHIIRSSVLLFTGICHVEGRKSEAFCDFAYLVIYNVG